MDLQLIKTKDIKELKNELVNIKNNNAEMQEEWLSTNEAAEYLKVSKRTLKRYRDAGKLAYSKDSRKIRFRKSDIIKYLNRHYFSIDEIST